MRIWIDTDIGSDVDDALALAYVLRHPDLSLVGISTVFGDVELRAAVARRLLTVGHGPDVPVLAGLGVPRTAGRPGRMFGHEGEDLLEPAELAGRTPWRRIEHADGPTDAARVAALAAAFDAARPDVVLAIGPLTNLAALVRAGVELPPIAVMGGKLSDTVLPGMPSGFGEWNWFCDPDAVRIVLGARHDRPPLIVPAEVTFRTALTADDLDALAGGDALAAALARLSLRWLTLQRDGFRHSHPAVALHDPLTAAVLVQPGLCTFAERVIDPSPDGLTDDGTAHPAAPGPGTVTVMAAVDVDPAAVRAHLMASWSGRAHHDRP